jgi:beta-glucanase (GH16 family)
MLPLIFLTCPLIFAAPKDSGNCVSGKVDLDTSRIMENPDKSITAGGQYKTVPTSVDVTKYDWVQLFGTVDNEGGGLNLGMSKPEAGAVPFHSIGTTISSTRYVLYGRITAELSVVDIPGAVSTFITYSDIRDEIDWEMVGSPVKATNNLFAKTSLWPENAPEWESGKHGGPYTIVENIGNKHTYVIDWKKDSIVWEIDGKVVRTLLRSESKSVLRPTEEFFPNTPSLVQFGIWDVSNRATGTVEWGGGNIDWQQDIYKYKISSVDIQCYDDNDIVVPKWPNTPENPDKGISLKSNSTIATKVSPPATTQTPLSNEKTSGSVRNMVYGASLLTLLSLL